MTMNRSYRVGLMALAVVCLSSLPVDVKAETHEASTAVASDASASKAVTPHEFKHPGIAHSDADIQRVKEKVAEGAEPWVAAWQQLTESSYFSLRWEPQPLANVERGASNRPDIGSTDFSQDARAAYTHALAWALSEEEAHARKASEIIDAWSTTLRSIENHDAKLLVGMAGHLFCNAAELLKHTWDGWPEQNQERFRSMVYDIWYPIIHDYYPSANGNWDASMLQTMIAMGVYFEDEQMFNSAVDYFRSGKGNGAIGNYFNEFGECQETGRDQAHTQMGLEFLANTAETAWNQGLDLYGELDNRLLAGFEYTAKYNLGFEVRYEPYRSFEGRYHYKRISDDSRGRLRPMYETVYRHYFVRQKLEAPYTHQALLKIRENELHTVGERDGRESDRRDDRRRRSGERRRNGGGASLLWNTLMYAS
ncbi:alginate lyase family protein [Neorhodopirellula lusitana]|nr:alginate lyase family protein [Neorhodopirellula lusitana]